MFKFVILSTALIACHIPSVSLSQSIRNAGDCNVNMLGSNNVVEVTCPGTVLAPFEAEIRYQCDPLDQIQQSWAIYDIIIDPQISREEGAEIESEIRNSNVEPRGFADGLFNTAIIGSIYFDSKGNSYRRLRDGTFVPLEIRENNVRNREKIAFDASDFAINSVLFISFDTEQMPQPKGLPASVEFEVLGVVLYVNFQGVLSAQMRQSMKITDPAGRTVEVYYDMRAGVHQCRAF